MVPRFDPHPAPRPSEPWDYIVDDEPPRYDSAGSARLLLPDHAVLRLVPDVSYRPWRNEAVMLAETERGDGAIEIRLRGAVTVGLYANGADVMDFDATIVDPQGERDITVFAPGEHRRAAMRKVLKTLDWYGSERMRRDGGWPRPSTAYEFWMGTRVFPRAS